jgi:hypothetical protein
MIPRAYKATDLLLPQSYLYTFDKTKLWADFLPMRLKPARIKKTAALENKLFANLCARIFITDTMPFKHLIQPCNLKTLVCGRYFFVSFFSCEFHMITLMQPEPPNAGLQLRRAISIRAAQKKIS